MLLSLVLIEIISLPVFTYASTSSNSGFPFGWALILATNLSCSLLSRRFSMPLS